MSYTIGSFNMLNANYASNKEQAKDYKKIAEIIREEDFDVVALQEVWTDGVLKKLLLPALGETNWEYRWQSPKPFSARSAEGYAYIWKKSRFRLVESGSNPTIDNRYQIRNNGKNLGSKGLIRPPYVIRLTTSGVNGGPFMELRFINTHIIFGKPASVTQSYSDLELRRKELRILSEEVYRTVSTKRYGDNMPSYTIMMGDYNLCLVGPDARMEAVIPITPAQGDNRPGMNLRTVQEELTSVKTPDQVKVEEGVLQHYAHNYDHFSYEESLGEKLSPSVSRVDALGKYYDYDVEAYRREISDHVPIKLVINLR